jgi:hypothetical protein
MKNWVEGGLEAAHPGGFHQVVYRTIVLHTMRLTVDCGQKAHEMVGGGRAIHEFFYVQVGHERQVRGRRSSRRKRALVQTDTLSAVSPTAYRYGRITDWSKGKNLFDHRCFLRTETG